MSTSTGPKSGSRDCTKQNSNNKKVKSQDEADCPWWINSQEHDFCFWNYIQAKSSPDGSMNELVQSEIAELMGWSNTKTHFMLKQAMQELIEALKAADAKELISNDSYLQELPMINIDPVTKESED